MAVSLRLRLALWFAHPYWLATVSGAGAIMAVEYSLMDKVPASEVRISTMAALAIGLPAVLYTKRLVRRHIEFYSEYSFVIGERAAQREFWRRNWRNLYANVPITAAVAATWALSRYLHVHWAPMLGMMFILCMLLYPEQEDIHERIRTKVLAMKNTDGTDGGG